MNTYNAIQITEVTKMQQIWKFNYHPVQYNTNAIIVIIQQQQSVYKRSMSASVIYIDQI